MAIDAYFNYPNGKVKIHGDGSCPNIRQHRKPDQHVMTVRHDNVGAILTDFIQGNVPFEPKSDRNDLWLSVRLSSNEQTLGLVHVIQAILSNRYTPFERIAVETHCG
jgi:hypothetical protein